MQLFNLSLAPRLALAALSGLLTYPANRLDTLLGPESYPPLFSWWLILHGLIFGLLVMAPFVTRNHRRGARILALAIASVFIYDLAIRIPDLIEIEMLGDTGDFIVAGISGAVLVATAVRFIAPLVVTPAYWGFSFLAGLVGGFVFSLAFEVCEWDQCAETWMILPYAAGWIVWQSLVCAAMFLGVRRKELSPGAYGFSVR
jgi:hypothetical protein